MSELRNRTRRTTGRAPQVRYARPVVEGLETRTMPSMTPLSVAQQIVNSPEGLANFVTQQYQTFLDRTPVSVEVNGWVNVMQQGLTREQMQEAVVLSPEFINMHGGLGTGWMTALYQDFLNRLPSQAEVNGWMGQLALGVPASLEVPDFATGPEREAIVISSDYLHLLGRLPSANEIGLWQVNLQNGLNQAGMEASIAGSLEFFEHNGGTNSGFIAAMYQDLLGRPASQAEINLWLNNLDNSTTGGTR
jgi:hypothetical protein